MAEETITTNKQEQKIDDEICICNRTMLRPHCVYCGSSYIYCLIKKTVQRIDFITKELQTYGIWKCRTCGKPFDGYQRLYECKAPILKTANEKHQEKVQLLTTKIMNGEYLNQYERQYINRHSPYKYEDWITKFKLQKQKEHKERTQDIKQSAKEFAKNFETLTPEEQQKVEAYISKEADAFTITVSQIEQTATKTANPRERLRLLNTAKNLRRRGFVPISKEEQEKLDLKVVLQRIEYLKENPTKMSLTNEEILLLKKYNYNENGEQNNGHRDIVPTDSVLDSSNNNNMDTSIDNIPSTKVEKIDKKKITVQGNLTDEDLRNLPGVMEIKD